MLLQRLRDETRSAHEQIERGLEASRAYVSITQYCVLVARFFGFYRGWEPRISTMLGDEEFFAPRRKIHLLRQDLGHLGYDLATVEALPRCPAIPALTNSAEAMGSLYVLEGSTLGGQVVSRRLERSIGLSDGRGYAFFRSYGREVGPMWRAFGERLLSTSSKATEDASIRSAQATFARLHSWLCQGI